MNEPRNDKTNRMTCAPSKHSDQSGHQSIRCPIEETLGPKLPIERTAKTMSSLRQWLRQICLRWTHMSFVWFYHAPAHSSSSLLHFSLH